uniref:uncharacterized protein LOC120342187 n=1 Tax=Styela clava TaxID=7725 RepID=UPI00193A6058|nr:uncharacterized protein LOC120342187 [Styela clava]
MQKRGSSKQLAAVQMSVSKQIRVLPTTPTSLPLVDKNIFNGRPEGILPDSVWVQVESQPAQSMAVHDAIIEQRKIDKVIEEKEMKLKEFQRNVQKRVTQISRAQRHVATKAQSENMKEEQEILYRSVAAAENLTPKKNRCTYNINQVTIDASGKLTAHYKHEYPTEKGATALVKQSSEIERLHRKARKNLIERSFVRSQENDPDGDSEEEKGLPGGFWGTSATRDKSARMLSPTKHPSYNVDNDNPDSNEDHPQTITAISAPHDIAIAAVTEGIGSSPAIKSKLQRNIEAIATNLPTALRLEDNDDDNKENEEDMKTEEQEFYSVPASSLAPSSVYFKSGVEGQWRRQEVIPCENHSPKQVAITRMGKNLLRESDVAIKQHKCHSTNMQEKSEYPVAAPGVVEHERKKMDERSRLLSRRVFSDMEREKVREERRRREHKCKVERLRAEKEAAREQLEKEHDGRIHAAAAKIEQRKIAKDMKEKRKAKKEKDKIEKQKRIERFATAIKAQIQERLEMNRITLPPLCCCSRTFWGTNPYTCANNCLFYRNMEAYTVALQSVLSTMERGMKTSKHEKMDHSVISLLLTDD